MSTNRYIIVPGTANGQVATWNDALKQYTGQAGGGGITTEDALDAVGAALVSGAGITITVNDPANTITIDSTITQYTDEQVRDVIGAALLAGSGITITVNDPGDSITIASAITQYTDEQVRDVMNVALTAGAGITITPNDPADTVTIATTITQYTDEMVRDVIGAALVAGKNISVTVDDVADTITIAVINNVDIDGTLNVDGASTLLGLVTADAGLEVRHTATDAFRVKSDDGIGRIIFNTSSPGLELIMGSDLRIYSDNLITKVFDADGATGTVEVLGALTSKALTTKTAAYTLTANDQFIGADATLGSFTLTLPLLSGVPVGKHYFIYRKDNSANVVTIDGNGSETIQDELSITLSRYQQAVLLVNAGSDWRIIGQYVYDQPELAYGRFSQVTFVAGSTTKTWHGTNNPTDNGTAANADANDGPWYQLTSGAVSGNLAGWNGPANEFRSDWDVDWTARVKTGGVITTSRFWIGLFSSAPTGADAPAIHIAAFRHSSTPDGTTWWAVTDNGSAAPTLTNTGVTIAINTPYLFRIRLTTTEAKFYIDDKLVATHTTKIPASGTALTHYEMVTTLAAAAKVIRINRVGWRMK